MNEALNTLISDCKLFLGGRLFEDLTMPNGEVIVRDPWIEEMYFGVITAKWIYLLAFYDFKYGVGNAMDIKLSKVSVSEYGVVLELRNNSDAYPDEWGDAFVEELPYKRQQEYINAINKLVQDDIKRIRGKYGVR